jgi:hypothetical protein
VENEDKDLRTFGEGVKEKSFEAVKLTPCKPKGQQYTLTVQKAGSGSGTVMSSPSGIDWRSDCLLLQQRGEEKNAMGIILIVILVLLLIGALPTWRHSKSWGPYPSGGIGLILLILIILLLLGRI